MSRPPCRPWLVQTLGLLALASATPTSASLNLVFLDVGQGDATLISADDRHVLVDGGRARDAAMAPLHEKGVHALDLIVATHAHADHIGGLVQVLEALPVDTLWYNGDEHGTQTFEAFLDAALDSDARYVEPTRGHSRSLGDLEVTVLHPGEETAGSHLHDRNLVVRVDRGACSAILTGDLETEGERAILSGGVDVEADVLDLGHHGSRTSTGASWLESVRPAFAVAQYGDENAYGHPHGEVLERVEEGGARVLGTGTHGRIRMQCTDGAWSVQTERSGAVTAGDRESEPDPAGAGAPSGSGDAGRSAECIDLNRASADALETIVHIGPDRARQIIDGRPWDEVPELDAIHGLGAARVRDIRDEGRACVP